MPVAKLISIKTFSLIFKIVALSSLFALLKVVVLLTGVNIFNVASHFNIDILNILPFFSAVIFFIFNSVILLSALYIKSNNFKFKLKLSNKSSITFT